MHLDAWAKLLSPSSVLRYFFDRKPAFFLITAFSSSWRLPKKIVGFLESTCIVSNLILRLSGIVVYVLALLIIDEFAY